MADEKQFALLQILESLSKSSAKAMIYTTAVLGLLALSPNTQLPPGLLAIAGGLGVNAMSDILDKVAFSNKISDEEITTLVKQFISESNLEKLLSKDDFWHGFSRIRNSQEKISEQNEIIIALLRQLESSPIQNTKILFADFSVLNEDYATENLGDLPIAYPTFSLQEVYDRTNNIEGVFPVIFDLKLVNKGDATAFLKEVRFEILDAVIDSSPVISYFPIIFPTKSGNNLLLALRNYGWGPVKVKEFTPFSQEIGILKEFYSDFLWSGEFTNNAYFIFPHTLIGQKIKNVLPHEDAEKIEDLSKTLRLPSPSDKWPISGPIIYESERILRSKYLLEGKGISYQDFNGKIVYAELGNEVEKIIHWGHFRPGTYCDLAFSEDGFHLLKMGGMAGYIPPSHNYAMKLSYSDKGKVKKIKVSQEIKPNSVERFTVTATTSESCVYRIKVNVLYDKSNIVYSEEIFVKFLAFRKNNGESYETYVYEDVWKKIRV